MNIRIHRILEDTAAEGPGRRFCIWVQGCERGCPGCFAVDTWDRNGGSLMDTAQIIAKLENRMNRQPPLEGVTFLGGEPFLQAAALNEIASFAKEKGLSVFCFTGYTLEELRLSGWTARELLTKIDLLADGPFIAEQREFSRPWVGSANQQFHYLTDRYAPEQILGLHNKVEIRLRRDGSILVNGMGEYRNPDR